MQGLSKLNARAITQCWPVTHGLISLCGPDGVAIDRDGRPGKASPEQRP